METAQGDETTDDYQNFAVFGRTTPVVSAPTDTKERARTRRNRRNIAEEEEEEETNQAENPEWKRFVEDQRRKFEEIDRVELPCVELEDDAEPKDNSAEVTEDAPELSPQLRTTPVSLQGSTSKPARKRRSTGQETVDDYVDLPSPIPKNGNVGADFDIDDIDTRTPDKNISGGCGDDSLNGSRREADSNVPRTTPVDEDPLGLSMSPIKPPPGRHMSMDVEVDI